jgi:ATP-binding cassette, subfamily B (MDR/TAP), member 1
MSLLFGNLTQGFVTFGSILQRSHAGDASATAQIPEAAAKFRHTAAQDATYLTFVGEFYRLEAFD